MSSMRRNPVTGLFEFYDDGFYSRSIENMKNYEETPQVYLPPADDPRDPRTKGMYPTGGFDDPPIAPPPPMPPMPPPPPPLDPGPMFPTPTSRPVIPRGRQPYSPGPMSPGPTGPMSPGPLGPTGPMSPSPLGPTGPMSPTNDSTQGIWNPFYQRYLTPEEDAKLKKSVRDNPDIIYQVAPDFDGRDQDDVMDREPLSVTPTPIVSTTGSSLTDASSNDIQRMLNRGTIATNDVSNVQGMISSPQPVTPPTPATAPVTEVPSGIMSQAPSSMTDPEMMGMMQSPMQQNSQVGSYTGGMSGYGGMGTGMSAGGGIMSMANPMQQQMSMMPQQMMQQGGYAPPPQTLSYGQSPFSTQSLYGSQTGSSNNQQNIYGQQQFNSPFAGASRGYYA